MVAWAGIIGAALFGRAAAQVGSWSMYAGYEPASDVGSHSMIDLDMAEIETAVGTYATSTVWISDALFIYDVGGNGGNGNSVKGSGAIRTIKGFATKDYSVFTGNYAEQLPPIYTAYWAANGLPQAETWANTFITKDYSAIVKDVGWAELIQKGANYQAVWMYVIHELEDAIGDCFAGDITANDDSVHAWDEAWATAPARAEPKFTFTSRDLTLHFHAGGGHCQNEPGHRGGGADGGRLRGGPSLKCPPHVQS